MSKGNNDAIDPVPRNLPDFLFKVRKMKHSGLSELEKILKEHEELTMELEAHVKLIEQRENELEKREAQNENMKMLLKYQEEMNKKAILEEKKKLAEEQKRKEEKFHRRMGELQKKLDAKQELELEEIIDKEDDKLRSLKDEFGNEVYEAVIIALKEMNQYNPSGDPVLELWNFREKRIATLKEGALKEQSSRASIGVKLMGDLDSGAFCIAAKKKYGEKDANDEAAELVSLWEEYLKDPS
ncbi:Factor of DNA methylation 3 [Camellia lanceoleosa]|uniref:Factor of DNA methylation 3 n=1 Tax=Camellia lanceoleosa TaxID=1840588 RepID=A0ACC0HM85_9ERIC|nr:Factor of DNA methylation 3 [Camellia lanceoleosa]